MISVGISGACGRMGRMAVPAVMGEADLTVTGLYNPGHEGESIAGLGVGGSPNVLSGCQVVLELTRPEVVDQNLRTWRGMGLNVVVGTSGFERETLTALGRWWGAGPPNCLIVPNFAIGAILMTRFAEAAAPYFSGGEVIELHHDGKSDAPSGTAVTTAERMGGRAAGAPPQVDERIPGVRGGRVNGIPVHSVRLPGLLAHQEVLFGNPGEVLTIRHDTTDRVAFIPGILLAIRRVADLDGVTVGLDDMI